MARIYPEPWAEDLFLQVLHRVQNGGTRVYEVTSFPLNTLEGKQRAIASVPHHSAIWQHTDKYHVAMIYIDYGHGKEFNRTMLDLIADGVDTLDEFRERWLEKNGDLTRGMFPTVKSSLTSSLRAKQASYIVTDFNVQPNPHSRIHGESHPLTTHRTHLISAQTTGIENHRGLLIDFDGWLNSKPLNQFENTMLNHAKFKDLIWTTTVWQAIDGLHYQYVMYNNDWSVFAAQEWVDDRWTYFWTYDEGQDQIGK